MRPRAKVRWIGLAFAGALLVLAGGVVTLGGVKKDDEAWVPLAKRIPMEVAGWEGQDVPLGPNEAVVAAVGTLNYDDYIYRVYRRGGVEVYCYAMYWRQGRISVREIAGHTPDGCWVANGARPIGEPTTTSLTIGGRKAAPAESRTFAFGGSAKIQVAWWHIWGAKLVDRAYAEKSAWPMLREIWTWLGQRSDKPASQFFIRVHSTMPVTEAARNPAVEAFLARFPEVFEATSS